MTEATQTNTEEAGQTFYAVPKNVDDAYYVVLDVANRVLRQCTAFSIERLREENPTIAEIARSMRLICKLMHVLEECDAIGAGWTIHKAHEYADHVQALADAIDSGDEQELLRQCETLKGRNFL
ncbi:hypothetical protein [Stutzerimonas nitrititolerans]|uniref:hypothetical protein n=1 Tax=Stutzerimonas nitrititolerans TaxID=2482751 RepID=UPI0028A1CEC9|nr:hypothetical protein [Stutzerimonas nitrititolerans]